MRTVRTPSLALAALLVVSIAAPVLAEPAPAIPERLYQQPDRQWVLSGCAADKCEAGYRSGDLVVSVRRDSGSVVAVAGVRGCQATAARGLRPATFEALSPADQYSAIQRTALGAAQTARSQCGSAVADLIDTAALVRVVPGQAY
jgi:hypothetical protein